MWRIGRWRVAQALRGSAKGCRHCVPIGNRGTNVGKHAAQIFGQPLYDAAAGTADFDQDHTFPHMAGRRGGTTRRLRGCRQPTGGVAGNVDHRVEQTAAIQARRGDCDPDRVNQEWHILADDRNRHRTRAFGAPFDVNDRVARQTQRGAFGRAAGERPHLGPAQVLGLARGGTVDQRGGERIDHRIVGTHDVDGMCHTILRLSGRPQMAATYRHGYAPGRRRTASMPGHHRIHRDAGCVNAPIACRCIRAYIAGSRRVGHAHEEIGMLSAMRIGGREVWPLIEGGKGVAATNHQSSGAWAAAGGIGTVSAVNADNYDAFGNAVLQTYHERTRVGRHEELIRYAIDGAVEQVKRAWEIAGGVGALNINVLWEMGGAQRVLEGVLEGARGLVHGVTCGAGMPYKLSEIAARYGVHYYPIISSARAFRALWKRAYSKASEWLGAVVYEDPWLAGGHNGLSNAEDPRVPQAPYPRVAELRATMREVGIADSVPIIMAGGVWQLSEWADWIDNPELGAIAFQFGTRPLLTQESPIPDAWKAELTRLAEGDILLHKFSPTGFYSSAVRNAFLRDLEARSERQIAFSETQAGDHQFDLDVGVGRGRSYWVTRNDLLRAREWAGIGYTEALKTPDNTLVYVTPDDKRTIRRDQADCMGCLSHCAFSAWKDHGDHSTGRLADPRSFCIQKTLQDIAHGGSTEHNLMFGGHSAYRFGRDPFYSNGFVPSVRQLIDRILTGA